MGMRGKGDIEHARELGKTIGLAEGYGVFFFFFFLSFLSTHLQATRAKEPKKRL